MMDNVTMWCDSSRCFFYSLNLLEMFTLRFFRAPHGMEISTEFLLWNRSYQVTRKMESWSKLIVCGEANAKPHLGMVHTHDNADLGDSL